MKHLSDSVNATPESAQPDLKTKSGWRRALNWAVGLVALAWVVVVLAWSALHIFIVPRIDDYREVLQQQVSRAMGLRVEVGSIRVQGGWWQPWFEVKDIVLFDHDGREALRLPQVLAAVSPRSALFGQFEQLDIEAPELEIRRDADGHIWVAGLATGGTGDGSGADWFFSQPDFLVRQGVVHWRDERRTQTERSGAALALAPVLTLQGVEVSVKNHRFHHALRISATPPNVLGQRLSVQGKLYHWPWQRAGDVAQWSGEVFAELPAVDLATLRQWVAMDKGLSLQEGRGAMRLWADLQKGQLTGVTADVALEAVTAHLGADLLPLSLHHVHGRVGAQWQNDEVSISSQDLVFDTQEGEHWPGGVLRMGWRGDVLDAGSLSAERLDLDALAQISQRLPLSTSLRGLLARTQPQGQVHQLKATWQKNDDASWEYSAQGQVRQLSLQRDVQPDSPLANVPSVQAAQVEFDLTHKGGKARLSVHHGSLTLPVGLDQPRVVLDDASAQLAWQLKGHDVAVQFTQGRLANDDVSGEFNGHWKTGEGDMRLPGVLDLTATLSRAKVAQIHRYLPNILPAGVRAYLRDAVQAGEASHVTMRLRGNLRDMPFDNPKLGEFRIVAQVAQGKYAYVPVTAPKASASTWPALTQLNGELVLERSALQFKGRTQLAGAPDVAWQKVEANIANLAQPEVRVTGEAHGPLAQVLDMVAKSALNDLTGAVLGKSQATGNANFKLALTLPLDKLETTKVQGGVTFADNALQIMPGTPVLNRTRGTLQFSEQNFELKAVQAQLLGGEALLDGGLSFVASEGQSPLQLKIRGDLTAEGLQQARELGFVSHLAQRAAGKSSYSATLGLRRGQPELFISSDLKGMALALPAPLNKTAQTTMPLRIESQLTRESLQPKSRVLQDQIKVTLGRLVSAVYVRDLSGPRTRVVRGGIAVGQSVMDTVPLRDSAVSLNLQLSSLDLDAWNTALTQVTGVSPLKRKAASKSVIGSEATGDDAQDYMPTFAALRADQIKVSDRMVHKMVVGGTRQGDLWRLNISADELNGFAEVRPPSGNASAQLYVRLAYLNIPPSSVSDVERLLTEQPSSIPTLDIVVNELTLHGKKLGRLEIDAVNRVGANAVREWRLNKFNVNLPEATLTANGSWAAEGPRVRHTQFNFVLAIRDSGELLTRLGTPDAIGHGEGSLEGQVSWQGSPITLDYATMSGKMHVSIEKGQFLKIDPGAARLLGVLNLQALPRRLTLDFSDLFSDGFAFDFLRGDVRIDQGLASTNNLQMKGVVAGALIEGSADLVRETQQLKVVVVPEINAGTASLYVATINPLIGLASYLAQLVLSRPLVRAGTTEFHVDGSWADPRVTKVD
ncbi:YhdP family protein [Limnohabitans sp.]|uniref:YhdP family protein n=1 Tax=Limnohabitans sp. TaxID=1907725 RepID=UPI00286EC824|nr:YhdP family protein [Limnohabitans sp.]